MQCEHRMMEMPAWKSGQRQNMIKHIMKHMPQLYAREQLGLASDDRKFVFRGKFLEYMFSRKRVSMTTPVPVVYLAIDPNGGGGSDLGIVSFFFWGVRSIVVSFVG